MGGGVLATLCLQHPRFLDGVVFVAPSAPDLLPVPHAQHNTTPPLPRLYPAAREGSLSARAPSLRPENKSPRRAAVQPRGECHDERGGRVGGRGGGSGSLACRAGAPSCSVAVLYVSDHMKPPWVVIQLFKYVLVKLFPLAPVRASRGHPGRPGHGGRRGLWRPLAAATGG